jgi:hypothetical protein
MRRALILAVLLLSLRADAGVAVLDTVSSCPSVIKNVITTDILLSDEFVPFDVINTVDIVNTVNIVDTINTVIRVDTVNTVGKVDTIITVDTTITVITVDTVITGLLRYARNDGHCEERSDEAIQCADTVTQESPEKKRKLKFGRRVAFNHSQVSNILVRIYTHDGNGFSSVEYRNKAIFGVGFEVAGIVDWAVSDALLLNFSPGVVFRKPVNTAVVGTSEVGLSFPVLFEWRPFDGVAPASESDAFAKSGRFDVRQLRLFGGIWAGAPLYARMKWNGEESVPFRDRSAADFGLVCGLGVYVSDKAFVDARGIFGLTGYDSAGGRRLNQLAIGVNYVK